MVTCFLSLNDLDRRIVAAVWMCSAYYYVCYVIMNRYEILEKTNRRLRIIILADHNISSRWSETMENIILMFDINDEFNKFELYTNNWYF